ncbi:MAG: hypothetical protein RL748_2366 [Pseudomonadota bacterium]|jgi:hypothetical protein
MSYLPLFSLVLQHDYYTDRCCNDFTIEATPETQKLLANFRCVLKPMSNGLRVLIQATSQGTPFIAMPEITRFNFQLRLRNPDFSLFTDLSAMAAIASPLFTHSGASRTLSPLANDNPAKLPQGVFASVRLNIAQPVAPLNDASNAFVLPFAAKKCRWKYYVVTSQAATAGNPPAIVDKDNAIMFDAANLTDLKKTPDPSDRIAGLLAQQYPESQLFRLLSGSLIPCQQAVRKTIQLMMNGEKVISALPSPVIQNYVIDAKSSEIKEDGLYHVINYLAI